LVKAESQAREAEIELALERVRARTMAMQHSDELTEASEVLDRQVRELGIETWGCAFHIYADDPEGDYEWFSSREGSLPFYKTPRENFFLKFYEKGKAGETFHVEEFLGEDCKVHYDYLMTIPVMGDALREIVSSGASLPESQYDHIAFFKHGFLLFITYKPVPESHAIFQRFAKVFEQTYTRFLDLQKAEAQAKEAKIEAALERVRSRTMAMHHTEELQEVIQVVFEQMVGLNIHLDHAGFILDYKEREDMHIWLASHQQGVPTEITFPYFNSPNLNSFRQAKAKQESFFANLLPFEVKNKFYRDLFELIPELTEEAQQAIFSKPALAISTVLLDNVGFYIQHYSETPFTAEENAILMRFGKVFQQTYTRFLDLQKAEAQAREAQIENALEKVRSRTMAMQHSEELAETSIEMFRQTQALGMRPWACGFNIFEKDEKAVTQWMSGGDGSLSTPFTTPLTEDPFFIRIYEARQRREELFVMESRGNELEETYKYMFGLPAAKKALGDILAIGFEMPKFQISHCAFFSQGYLMFITYEPYPEAHDIFRRFAKVFEQTYTRFLDLQKAEAQAREAQIEAALEKVRSRSLAMHKSGELNEVVSVLFERLKELQIPFTAIGIGIYIEGSKDLDSYVCGENEAGLVITNYRLPYFENQIVKDCYNALEKQLDFFVGHYSKEEKDAFYNYVIENTAEFRHLPEDIKRMIFDSTNYTISTVAVKNAVFNVNDFEGKVLAEEEVEIIQRFARVFDQAYIRFLDLQKAEAQAREAQIEAGLERVRSKSLAMHKTAELQSVIHTVHQELLNLNISISGGSFIVINSEIDNEIQCWGSGGTADTSDRVHIPHFEKPFYTHLLNGIKNGPGFFTEEYTQEEKIEFFTFLFQHEPWSKLSAKEKKNTLSAPGGYTRSCAVAKHTSIFIINHFGEKFSEAENAILKRFGKVFDQTYTRFLDLQKAEAQTREAQIQLSLERIRAKAMAMQHSDELSGFLTVLFEQFNVLNLNPVNCHLNFLDIENNRNIFRITGKRGAALIATQEIDLDASPLWKKRKEDWKAGHPNDVDVLHVPYENHQEINVIFEELLSKLPKEDRPLPEDFPDGLYVIDGYCRYGYLGYSARKPPSDEEKEITRRIAHEFGNVYQRFLDLEKAEAQVREAQIQLSLERIRAKAMAMQHSDELSDFLTVVFEQFHVLNLRPVNSQLSFLDFENNRSIFRLTGKNGATLIATQEVDLDASPVWKQKVEEFKAGQPNAVDVLFFPVEMLPQIVEMFKEILEKLPEDDRPTPEDYPNGQYLVEGSFKYGYLGYSTSRPPTEEEKEITRRITHEFGNVYQRFLDLQKAEAQARESQIQLAMERVRARTMAMQHSSELGETSALLFQQIQNLGVPPWSCGFNIWEQGDSVFTSYMGSPDGAILDGFKIPLTEDATFIHFQESRDRGDKLFVDVLEGETLEAHYSYFLSLPEIKKAFEKRAQAGEYRPTFQINHLANFSHGNLMFITYEPCPQAHDIFIRFAKVFEQTYTRFLDLQKAEAQAREAQIENALEKVRSRTMAMQRSDELTDVAGLLFNQVSALGIKTWTTGFNVWSEDNNSYVDYLSLNGEIYGPNTVHTEKAEALKELSNARKSGVEFDVLYVEGEKIKQLYLAISGIDEKEYDIMVKDGLLPSQQYEHFVFGAKVSVMFITYEPVPEAYDIFKRLGKVFEQTYTRFLDLQKAEEQARESEIEVALEKVRSRSLAMHKSDELKDVVFSVFERLGDLQIQTDSTNIVVYFDESKKAEFWTANEMNYATKFTLPMTERFYPIEGVKYRKEQKVFLQHLPFEEKNRFWEDLFETSDFRKVPEARKNFLLEKTDCLTQLIAFGKVTGIMLNRYFNTPFSDADIEITERFAKVFDQAYTRFLDLQKAEAQARESQIANALEKVRSRSLAMQSPDELNEVAQLLREEMGALGVEELETSSIYIQDESSGLTQCWFTIKNPDNPDKAITDQMTLDLQDTWVGRKMDEFYRSKAKQTSILMQGEQRIEWIRYCEEKSERFGTSNFYGETIPDRTYHLYKFSNGYIGAAAPGEISLESWDLLKRATAVFSLAYTRFKDLQMAQASARSALRQASLDRVRAEISSMRHVNDLDRITPIFFHELTTLGIPFIRCGVFIIQEKQEIVEAYLSSPDGNSLGVLRLPYQASELTFQTVEAWRKGAIYRQHWNKEDFIQWINQLMEQDQIQDSSTYQGAAVPPESLDLHFVPFAQGMLYVGAVNPLDEKELELVLDLAKAFSIAYARYEDFVKLEQAKAEVESAMSELKATQSQLVQQEKLASLGQLTAGIAHEIKNPLNFVNNFSEVSMEMIEEIKEERAKNQETRDETLVDEILEDIQSNLGKIHQHGSRANGIVTSMLQHSRGGSGKMEPTDLNALIKEYVNLSFHGMRAGKNPINVDIILDLDPDLGMVSMIKEDFTRVVINLCNNAFDAMREKVKLYHVPSLPAGKAGTKYQEGVKYLPKLKVSTMLENGRLRLSFEDNGPGIQDEIKDKILQPFFTTKKGTEGTGLGLSITHDIIKAHGGELKVETKIGEGTAFIIQLEKKA
jgi:signal transduction histidine kinase